ncbi:PDR/VanB family oxidoreductase [Pseudomonas sp. SLFW]|uniref:PDR/VanB family oxidoreductase n=1 Tax=Pseudomonas sp. SLFW TaxID=2683259 RepID=UPI00141278E5|nr:PDR/VanB family oxidoreductase [Pseudomonas sp. SLFW]NBB13103.1 2Fe-2S iron-sulfur cluster binding domain-containing protein [Pseudomonas sp. SLFW]
MIDVCVVSRRSEAIDIDSFELERVDGAPLPPFTAGAHIDVHLRSGLTRQYSLCNGPHDTRRYRIGVLKDPASRGGSQAMHALQVGDTLSISEPRNLFPLVADAKYSMLFAGGIGITPILCMARELFNRGAPFELHYCTRSVDRMAFLKELREAGFAHRVFFHFDDTPSKLDAAKVLEQPMIGSQLYVCGPNGFMNAVLGTAEQLNWPADHLHREYFAAPVVQRSAGSFDVVLNSTGETYHIPDGKSVVEVLAESGIEIPVSCEQGICGTCLTKVLDGTPDHRDMFMTQEEHQRNNQFTPCCSRAKSPRLVLDL